MRSVREILGVCQNTLQTGTPHTLQRWPIALPEPLPSQRYLDWEIRRIQTTEGEPVGLLLTLNDVTDQKTAEDRLRLLASVLETTTDFVSVHAPDGAVLFLNHSARVALGLDARDSGAHLHLRDLQPDWAQAIASEKGFPKAIRHGSWEGETAFQGRDGREMPVSQLICAHRNPAGEIEFFSSILRDISERKAIETMRLESANRYDLAIRASGQLLFDWDIHTGEITYSGDALRVFGISVEELSGGVTRLRTLVHPEDREKFNRQLDRIAQKGEPLLHEFRVPHPDERIVHVQARGFPLSSPLHPNGRMIGFLEDVTLAHEFKESQHRSQEILEKRVQERTAELAAATEVIEDRARQQAAIARLGERALSGLAIPELLKEAAETLVAILRTDFCSIRELTADGEWLALKAAAGWPPEIALESLRAGNNSQSGYAVLSGAPVIVKNMLQENRFGISDSVRKTGCQSGASVPIAFGERALGAVSVFARAPHTFTRDDTHFMQAVANVVAAAMERQRAADGLLHAREQAERANRAKSVFLSRMSHELRTPLNAILGFAQLLQIESQNPALQESISHITRAGQHLLALINDVLDMAKIEAGRVPLTLEPVDVRSVLRSSLELMQPIAERHSIRMHLSEPTETPLANGDRLRIKQVALNFLSNAIKYSPAGSLVEAGIERQPQSIRLWVRDQGPGIPLQKQARLFHPFERLGAEQGEVEGTGIGLSLCRGLVEAMRGSIGCECPSEGGSVFWAEIPLAEHSKKSVAEKKTHVSPPAPPSVSTGFSDDRIKILCLDSHPFDVQVLESMLGKRSEYALITALHGELALELAREHQPQILLIDPELADMTFVEFIERKRKDPLLRDIPLVVTSGEMENTPREEVQAPGAAYLPKPWSPKSLLEALQTACKKNAGF